MPFELAASDHDDLYRRQFVIGREPFELPGWSLRRLGSEHWLAHAPDLEVAVSTDAEQNLWFLLGTAVETRPGKVRPIDQLRQIPARQILRESPHWSGRWLLIGDGVIYPDATCSLGCFWSSSDGRTDGGRTPVISSSIALAAQLRAGQRLDDIPSVPADGLAYFPPPLTAAPGIRKLLPSQALSVSTGEVQPTPVISVASGVTSDEAPDYRHGLESLRSRLTTAVANLSDATRSPLWLSLTAGLDTRTIQAACMAADVPVRACTMEFDPISEADLALPPKLASVGAIEHSFMAGASFDPRLEALFDRHTWGHYPSRVLRPFVSRGGWRWMGADDIMLNGSFFEIGRCAQYRRFPQPRSRWSAHPSTPPSPGSLVKMFGLPATRRYNSSMHYWRSWAVAHPIPGMDWRDRFHWEHRQGGWRNYGLQAADLLGNVISPVNSGAIMELLLSMPLHKRYFDGGHQSDLIAMMAPELLSLPVNPPDRGRVATPRGGAVVERARRAAADPRRAVRHRLRAARGRIEARQILEGAAHRP